MVRWQPYRQISYQRHHKIAKLITQIAIHRVTHSRTQVMLVATFAAYFNILSSLQHPLLHSPIKSITIQSARVSESPLCPRVQTVAHIRRAGGFVFFRLFDSVKKMDRWRCCLCGLLNDTIHDAGRSFTATRRDAGIAPSKVRHQLYTSATNPSC